VYGENDDGQFLRRKAAATIRGAPNLMAAVMPVNIPTSLECMGETSIICEYFTLAASRWQARCMNTI
jgi:hypothetical protein